MTGSFEIEKRLLPEKRKIISELIQRESGKNRFVVYADAVDLMAKVMEALGFTRVDSGGFKGAAFGLSNKNGSELIVDFAIVNSANVVSVSRDYTRSKEEQVVKEKLSDQINTRFAVRIIACLETSEVVFLPLYADGQSAEEIVRSILDILYEMVRKNNKLELFFSGSRLREYSE